MRYISLGYNCHTIINLSRVFGGGPFLPFDYCGTYDLAMLLDLIKNRLDGFLDASFPDNPKAKRLYHGPTPTLQNGCCFRHDAFSSSADAAVRASSVAKLGRRCIRFLNAMYSGNVTLVRNCRPGHYKNEESLLAASLDDIRSIYHPSIEFKLLEISTEEWNEEIWDFTLKNLGPGLRHLPHAMADAPQYG